MKTPTLTAALVLTLALPLSAQEFPGTWMTQTVAEGLDYPWDLASGGSELFLTEKNGFVLQLEGDALTRLPIETSTPIETDGGRGLLGMALAPDFASSNLGYFYQSTASGNRVIEARREADAWRETRVVLDGIPGHRLYNGGRIAFGPDGTLYVTTGWTENRALPQDMDSLAGKILRIAQDGSIPADNPFPGSPIWSLGHRNPQGLTWDDQGRMFAAEHGQSAHDEVNLIVPGGNYGWPDYQADEAGEGMTGAYAHSGSSTWAPSGIAMHEGRLIVAALVAQGLLYMPQDGEGLVPLLDMGDRMRDVQSLDGAIYAITTNRSPRGDGPSEDRLIRLTPAD